MSNDDNAARFRAMAGFVRAVHAEETYVEELHRAGLTCDDGRLVDWLQPDGPEHETADAVLGFLYRRSGLRHALGDLSSADAADVRAGVAAVIRKAEAVRSC
jgi:hypothetical protein